MSDLVEVEIVDFMDVVDAKGAAHTEYCIQVSCLGGSTWEVSRRYSAFSALYQRLRPSVPKLADLTFPRKSVVR